MSITVEDAFRLGTDLDGWVHSTSVGRVSAEIKAISKATVVIRFTYPVNVPMHQLVAVLRPEAASLWSFGLPHVQEARITNHFAPGDAIVTIRNNCRVSGRVSSLIQRFRGWKLSKEAWNTFRMREIVRCNYPNVADTFIVSLPLDPDKDNSTAVWCGKVALKLSEVEIGSQTLFHEFVLAPCRFRWLLPFAVEQMCKYRNVEACRWEGVPTEFFTKAVDVGCFIVLRMRKCCRGPPLSPIACQDARDLPAVFVELDGTYWLPEKDPRSFSLCSYLKHMLTYCGQDSGLIFDRLDGRRLIYFEAAVQGSLWPSLHAVIQPVMKMQQQAYRRFNGGSAAPHLHVENSPRFQDDAPDLDDLEDFPSDSEDLCLATKGTFIHFEAHVEHSESTWSI